jgi:hypothetical protein
MRFAVTPVPSYRAGRLVAGDGLGERNSVKTTIEEQQQLALTQGRDRMDMYTAIHKALRAMMCDTLVAVGRLDPQDEPEVVHTAQRVFDLLEICRAHLAHENAFVHVPMQARAPGSADTAAQEHAEHEHHIAQLSHLTGAMVKAAAALRAPLALALYRALALFVADNLRHMAHEETQHSATLWAHFSDAQLHEMHGNILAAIGPQEMATTMRWMIPACNPQERAETLLGMRAGAPAPVFQAVVEGVRPHMDDSGWAKLCVALDMAPQPGLTATVA